MTVVGAQADAAYTQFLSRGIHCNKTFRYNTQPSELHPSRQVVTIEFRVWPLLSN